MIRRIFKAAFNNTKYNYKCFNIHRNKQSSQTTLSPLKYQQQNHLWTFGTEKPKYKKTMSGKKNFPLVKSELEWQKELTPDEYYVLRQKGTELAGTGEYDKFYPEKDEGYFECRACKHPLYSAASKFNSGCGWPAFDKCYKDALSVEVDRSLGMSRIEIMCNNCGGHLGHVFEGEGFTNTNERHCVNSLSLKFVKGGKVAANMVEMPLEATKNKL
eukprot:g7304.t1